MKPQITLLTLGVDDLERAVAFYRDGLGFGTKGIIGTEFENGAVAFFNLQSGLKLALWPRKSLSADSGLPLQASNAVEFSIGHNVLAARGGCCHASGRASGHQDRQTGTANVLWRLRRLLSRSRRHLWEAAFNPGFASLG
jgi:hypothetical protein